MKYCTKCGAQLRDDFNFCDKCGQPVSAPEEPFDDLAAGNAEVKPQYGQNNTYAPPATPHDTAICTVTKVFMVLGCVLSGFYLIPLCWTIPMTVYYFNRTRDNLPVGTGFKICSALFVSLIGGILMCFDKD